MKTLFVLLLAGVLGGCASQPRTRAVSTTTVTSAEAPRSRDLELHVSTGIAEACGSSDLDRIAACLSRGALRGAKVTVTGRIPGGEHAEDRAEHAMANAEKVRRYLLDRGVRAGKIVTGAEVARSIAMRDTERVDLELAEP